MLPPVRQRLGCRLAPAQRTEQRRQHLTEPHLVRIDEAANPRSSRVPGRLIPNQSNESHDRTTRTHEVVWAHPVLGDQRPRTLDRRDRGRSKVFAAAGRSTITYAMPIGGTLDAVSSWGTPNGRSRHGLRGRIDDLTASQMPVVIRTLEERYVDAVRIARELGVLI
jgi:hypothetical protein